MTRLERPVRRRVRRDRVRDLVVSLVPARGEDPARLEVREWRRSKGFSASLETVYRLLAEREVQNARASRRGARGTSLLTGGAR